MNIQDIAVAFQNGVKVSDRTYRLKKHKACFIGSEAVDFLVRKGIAQTRHDAVRIGQQLMTEVCLFAHVKNEAHEFQDDYLFYRFTSTSSFTATTSSNSEDTSPISDSAMTTYMPPKQQTDLHRKTSFAQQLHQSMEAPMRSASRKVATAKLGNSNYLIGIKPVQEGQVLHEDDAKTKSDEEVIMMVDPVPLDMDPHFQSKMRPGEMRCLGLVAHNHMKPAMKSFVLNNQNLLRKFRLTGTGTTMEMLREVLGEEHMEKYGGPVCKSGPLGGDAELVAQMCSENLGAIFFFQDPMDAHPHSADIECLNRQANVHNVMVCTNPTSAHAMTFVLREALKIGEPSMIPSFFFTLESPSVKEYKLRQAAVLAKNRMN